MNTKNGILSIVLSVLLALSACGPLAAYLCAPPVAYADDETLPPDVPQVPLYPCSVCGVNPVDVPGGVCASCSAAPKSSITLSAAGGAVANPVEYNIYKLFSADVDDETGMASNIGYDNYPMEVKIGSCVASSSRGGRSGIVARAMEEIGKPYAWGAVGPDAYDTSGLVSYCVSGQHTRLGTVTSFLSSWEETTSPVPGDICLTSSHCGVYIGNGQMVHAPSAGKTVCVSAVHSGMVYRVAPAAASAAAVSEDDAASSAASAQENAEYIAKHIADGSTLEGDSFGMALAREVAAPFYDFALPVPSDDAPEGGILVSPSVAAALCSDTGSLTLLYGADRESELANVPYAMSADCPDDEIMPSRSLYDSLYGEVGGKGSVCLVASDGSKIAVPSDVPTIKSDGVPVEVDGPGYYLLVRPDTLTGENTAASSPIFVLVGNGNTTATEKSAVPSVHKFVKENSTGEWGKTADQTIGQNVDIRLVGTLPADLASYAKYSYKFVDTPFGLSGMANLKVSIDGVEVPSDKYSVSGTTSQMSIGFDDLLSCGVPVNASSQVLVEYSATLTEYIAAGATNTVYVEYSNNPANDASRGETVKDAIKVLSWTLSLDKVDHATGAVLPGVGFTVKASDGRYVASSMEEDEFGEIVETLYLSDTAYTFKTDADGKISLEGLDSGTYTIEETAPLADYKPLSAPFTVSISPDAEYVNISYALGDTSDYVSLDGFIVKVENVKKIGLPLTGGPGYALAALGLVLVGYSVYRIRKAAK